MSWFCRSADLNDWGRPSVPSRFLKEIPLNNFEKLSR